MKPEIRDKWAEALESGEFAQGLRGLRFKNSYCCLGVLCELYRRETGEGRWVRLGSRNSYSFAADGEGSADYLPPAVRKWAGVNANPRLGIYSASVLNDSRETFTKIAKLVRQLPGEQAT